jgi:hypothetical protein
MTKKILTCSFLAVFIFSVIFGGKLPIAQAASLTSVSDALSRAKVSTLADHTIQFITSSGVGAGETITLTFPDEFDLGSFSVNNVDLAVSSGGTCTSFSDKTLSTSASGTTWGVGQSGQVITFTSDSDTIASNRCVQIQIGANATTGSAGASVITNPSAADNYTIEIAGTMADSGSATVPILSDDQVQISATVAQSLTFSLSANSISFGTLTTSGARYANTSTGATSDTAAHTMTIATNAPTGYSITYYGPTLTSGSNTISAATITGDEDGTPGSSQFAMGITTSGSSTIASGYENASDNWKFVPSTVTPLISATAPVNSETISNHYLANVSATTPAGNYTTAINYEATANF